MKRQIGNMTDYEKIEKFVKDECMKIMEKSKYESFTKLPLKSQLLGLKVFAFIAKEFDVIKRIERIEEYLGNQITMD